MTLRWTVVWERLNKAAIKLNALTGTIVGTIGPNPPKSGVEVSKKLKECGAEGQNRTGDTVIFSHVLYQLSYLGTGRRGQSETARDDITQLRTQKTRTRGNQDTRLRGNEDTRTAEPENDER